MLFAVAVNPTAVVVANNNIIHKEFFKKNFQLFVRFRTTFTTPPSSSIASSSSFLSKTFKRFQSKQWISSFNNSSFRSDRMVPKTTTTTNVVGSVHHQIYQKKLRYISSSSTLVSHHHQSPAAASSLLKPAMKFPEILHSQPPLVDNKPAWREAASLIIVAGNDDDDDDKTSNFDYDLLMVKRSSQSSFGSAFVFPGGQIEFSDFDSLWYDLYRKLGVDLNELKKITTDIVGPRPPIITDSLTLKCNADSNAKFIHLDLGLRISAIRETFEEAGILLLVDPKNRSDDYCPKMTLESLRQSQNKTVDLGKWQKLVRSDSKKFLELCDHLKMVPNVWALYEWSNWLTPTNVGHRRFDTIFYVCCFRSKPPVFVDNAEIIKPLWCSPCEILEQHQLEEVFLVPPQVYEISRMINFKQLDRFQRFMKSRQTLGTQRWLSVILTYDDGALSLVPGDEFYPEKPELITQKPVAELSGSIHDVNRRSKFINRLELQGLRCRTLCNVEPGCGHLPPVTYPIDSPVAKL